MNPVGQSLDRRPGPWHRSPMVMVRGFLIALVLVGSLAGLASAQPGRTALPPPPPPKPNVPALVGVTEVVKINPPAGFIDDVVAADAQRIAYVVADTSGQTELHVYTRATKLEYVVDIAAVTTQPVALAFAGQRVFVVGKTEDGQHLAALVEIADRARVKAGTVVYRLGPANDITVVTRDGKQRVAVHKVATTATGARHEVELVAIETGKRVAKAKPFELDAKQQHAKLGFTVNHWSDGFTRAYGTKAGEWNRKENERDPDVEAAYDLVTGKVYDKKKIVDLVEQRKRFQVLAGQPRLELVRMTWDNSAIEWWNAGKLQTVSLDQPITNYDPASLQGLITSPDGSGWIALKVDPVNVDAVARKKADPEYLDIFRVAADGKATRKSRVLSHRIRHRFGVAGDQFWLLERLAGPERGARNLTLYQPQ